MFTAYFNCTEKKIGIATATVTISVKSNTNGDTLTITLFVKKFCKETVMAT